MKKKVLSLTAALVAIGIIGCTAPYEDRLSTVRKNTTFKKYNIDQVFRDSDGYIIVYHDKDGRVFEEKYEIDGTEGKTTDSSAEYYSQMTEYHDRFKGLNKDTKQGVIIYKDLKSYEQGYALILKCRVDYNSDTHTVKPKGRSPEYKKDVYFVEIHLPLTGNLKPGVGEDKHGTDSGVYEIK